MGRQASARIMKGLIVLALIGFAVALPQRGGGRRPSKGQQQKKPEPKTIIRCWAENFGDDARIKSCVDCFEADIDFSTQAGLDTAKACAAEYWPKGVAACPSEIAALRTDDMETLGAVVECFDDKLETDNAQRCLDESDATEPKAKLTEGTMCVLDSWKMAFGAVKNMTRGPQGRRPRGGRRQGGRGGRGKGMKKMMMKTLLEAHCDNASNDDKTKAAACVKCFNDALPTKDNSKLTGGRNGRGGRRRGRREAPPAVVAALATCSQTHLSPQYDDCTTLMASGTDMKAAHQCYPKVLLGSVVGECVDDNGIEAADPSTLNEVVDCGVENVFEWLQEKNPKAAEKLEMFLKKMGGDDEEDDDA